MVTPARSYAESIEAQADTDKSHMEELLLPKFSEPDFELIYHHDASRSGMVQYHIVDGELCGPNSVEGESGSDHAADSTINSGSDYEDLSKKTIDIKNGTKDSGMTCHTPAHTSVDTNPNKAPGKAVMEHVPCSAKEFTKAAAEECIELEAKCHIDAYVKNYIKKSIKQHIKNAVKEQIKESVDRHVREYLKEYMQPSKAGSGIDSNK
ncbi:hypothetical protein C8034_v005651 [Colletotrichum sidae]|uniref:Uncharacterized protein n=1 Tax=Colletotrichum sidae TaxID=1347389 RepID=A0A4R8TRG2_9PEZI|nr:hypothetical protein C8034_v005651 [Colletotrichum sidae]